MITLLRCSFCFSLDANLLFGHEEPSSRNKKRSVIYSHPLPNTSFATFLLKEHRQTSMILRMSMHPVPLLGRMNAFSFKRRLYRANGSYLNRSARVRILLPSPNISANSSSLGSDGKQLPIYSNSILTFAFCPIAALALHQLALSVPITARSFVRTSLRSPLP